MMALVTVTLAVISTSAGAPQDRLETEETYS